MKDRSVETVWREAYAAALKSRHWEGMVAVGDAYRCCLRAFTER